MQSKWATWSLRKNRDCQEGEHDTASPGTDTEHQQTVKRVDLKSQTVAKWWEETRVQYKDPTSLHEGKSRLPAAVWTERCPWWFLVWRAYEGWLGHGDSSFNSGFIHSQTAYSKVGPQAGKRAQWIKVFVAKTVDLSLIPRTHITGENEFPRVIFWPPHTKELQFSKKKMGPTGGGRVVLKPFILHCFLLPGLHEASGSASRMLFFSTLLCLTTGPSIQGPVAYKTVNFKGPSFP